MQQLGKWRFRDNVAFPPGRLPQRHTDFFADQQCKGKLVPVGRGIFWCSVCGTEFQYEPELSQVTTIYPDDGNTQ